MVPFPVSNGGQGPATHRKSTGHCWAIVALVFFVLLPIGKADAYMAMRVGLSSNLLIHDGRVYFVQTDDGLTVLNLATGDLIMRKTDRAYTGRLFSHTHGILSNGREGISLLDPDTLDPIWRAEGGYPSHLTETRFLSHVDDRLICLDLDTGDVLWSHDLQGMPGLIVVGDHVLVSCGEGAYSSDITHVLLMDLANGDVLFDHSPSEGRHISEVYFDGELAYVLDGPAGEQEDDDYGYPGYGAANYVPDTLTTLNTAGEVIDVVTDPLAEPSEHSYYIKEFTHTGKVFREDGRVEPVEEGAEPDPPAGVYDLPAGTMTIEHMNRSTPDEVVLVSWESDETRWRGYLPHMAERWSITDVQSNGGYVVLGTDGGVVECIDAETGQSRWLYVFPTSLMTLSYSSPNGMPPHLTSLRANFIRDNRVELKARPMIRLPDGFDVDAATPAMLGALPANTASRIVHDPNPFDPYDWLPPFVWTVWGIFVLSAVLTACLVYLLGWRKRYYLTLAACSAGLVWMPVGAVYRLGRVSWPATLCLKLLLLGLLALPLIYVLLAMKRRRSVMRVVASVIVILALLFASHYALPVLRYA